MKKDEKSVMEKLRLFGDAVEEPPTVTEELSRKMAEIKFAAAPAATPRKRIIKPLFASLSAAAAAIIITLCCFLIADRFGEPYMYEDKDLNRNEIQYPQFAQSFEVLYPSSELTNLNVLVFNYKKNKKNVYCFYEADCYNGKLEVQTVFVNNYNIANHKDFEELNLKGTSPLFEYDYKVTPELKAAYAEFRYGGYRYYFSFVSENAEQITEILEGLIIV